MRLRGEFDAPPCPKVCLLILADDYVDIGGDTDTDKRENDD